MREQLIRVACATTALGCLMSNSLNAQTANQEIKKCVEGAFALEEFKKDGVVYRSPQIAGRYVVLDGTVSFIFHDRALLVGLLPGLNESLDVFIGNRSAPV
jgi:hypothetical protein